PSLSYIAYSFMWYIQSFVFSSPASSSPDFYPLSLHDALPISCRGDPGRPPGGARVPLRRSGVHSAGVVVGTVVRRGSGTVGRRPVGGTRYAFHGFRTAAPVTLGGTDRTPPGRCRTRLEGGPRRGGRTHGGCGGPRRGVHHRHRPGNLRPRDIAYVRDRRGSGSAF